MLANGVLIVEDQRVVAKDLEQTLLRLGYRVAGIAGSGEDAIRKAYELHPDLILMDVQLPGQLDGIEATRVIHQRLKVPIIYLTAFSDAETLRRASLTGPSGYLVKPLHEAELHCAMEVALSKSPVENVNKQG